MNLIPPSPAGQSIPGTKLNSNLASQGVTASLGKELLRIAFLISLCVEVLLLLRKVVTLIMEVIISVVREIKCPLFLCQTI